MVVCPVCRRQFSSQCNLNRHLRVIHQATVEKAGDKTIFCQDCDERFFTVNDLRTHLEEDHGFDLEYSKLRFANMEEFYDWKKEEEDRSLSMWILTNQGRMNKAGHRVRYFICCRSGKARLRNNPQRRTKAQGSRKTNTHCISTIKVTDRKDCVDVTYCKTHYGHDRSFIHVPLPQDAKNEIAGKIALGIENHEILRDIRLSVNDAAQRKHLLNNKDIHNIRASLEKTAEKVEVALSRHEEGVKLIANVFPLKEDCCWKVGSDVLTSVYNVVKKTIHDCNDSCMITCSKCPACLKGYRCTCLVNSIERNLCEHIHAVVLFENNDNNMNLSCETDTDNISVGVAPVAISSNSVPGQELLSTALQVAGLISAKNGEFPPNVSKNVYTLLKSVLRLIKLPCQVENEFSVVAPPSNAATSDKRSRPSNTVKKQYPKMLDKTKSHYPSTPKNAVISSRLRSVTEMWIEELPRQENLQCLKKRRIGAPEDESQVIVNNKRSKNSIEYSLVDDVDLREEIRIYPYDSPEISHNVEEEISSDAQSWAEESENDN